MKIAIHQPEFLPWLGFFYKMILADLYVVFDHVQFKKRYFENRNKIVFQSGDTSWINVPVKTKGKYTQSINEVEIDNDQKWKSKMLTKIQHCYRSAPYFEEYYHDFVSLLDDREYDKLIDLNMEIINFIRKKLDITVPMLFSSSMDVGSSEGSDLILKICLVNNANTYLCGASGKDYLNVENFDKNGIVIEWLDYQPPVYKQLCQQFTPYMSILDLLFNYGSKSLGIIMKPT
ncbi:hypothetical protein SCALIN_C45_0065 [Candidatus Scalindua japonica]|uniref:Uncharacterized protein n=1 Tax=Candidatus Scalindua japonica TaxID=1284222 RepID=A0A286U452_9BACT|nr:WbqC family protein [Candidatus Scalindua japonica]GAX62907.1 hypothetical protein SCALIN_C45_0065 [Candidatus Scalindua japonica]